MATRAAVAVAVGLLLYGGAIAVLDGARVRALAGMLLGTRPAPR